MRRNRKGYRRARWLGIAGLALLPSFASLGADNVLFHGALVAEPCVIPPGEETLQLDFGTVIDKYLYLNQRTQGQQFELHLTECDLSLGSTVRVTFSGNENPHLPGLLALDGTSQASGIAIGMETPQGKPLPLNQVGQKYSLAKDNNLIAFNAYVQGEPEAIANETIERGPFSAVATFSLEYE
ncbi:type 1 fimbrial protein [Rahnella sp. FC061912-K]|uniref:fimbrial protein n=1 Tax=Rahnella rivi TaxID=2816249 RepID=UPI001C25E2B2|nr:fimbrial protein [Rahnella rivi]MBU9828527.1 type 1 fimbrial protein [Rahnella rivi]